MSPRSRGSLLPNEPPRQDGSFHPAPAAAVLSSPFSPTPDSSRLPPLCCVLRSGKFLRELGHSERGSGRRSRVLGVSHHPQQLCLTLLSRNPWYQSSFTIQTRSARTPILNQEEIQAPLDFLESCLLLITSISYSRVTGCVSLGRGAFQGGWFLSS